MALLRQQSQIHCNAMVLTYARGKRHVIEAVLKEVEDGKLEEHFTALSTT